MSLRSILALILFVLSAPTFAQYWAKEVKYDSLVKPVKGIKDKYACLLDERSMTLAYDLGNGLAEKVVSHFQYYLNTQDAIDGFNKIYLPQNGSSELLEYNTRVISPNGTVRELSTSDIKTGTTEDGSEVTYYAVSGVEVGSIVEYYYVFRRAPILTGLMLTLQRSVPTVKTVVKITAPKNFIFNSLSLNGLAELKEDTSYKNEENHQYLLEQYNMPATVDEKFTFQASNTMSLIYQLYENTSTQARNIYNYGDASKYLYKYLNAETDKSTNKALEKLLKATGWEKGKDDREKIFLIENYVKRNFSFDDDGAPERSDLATILITKAVNDNGAAVLLFKLYQLAGIPLDIVVTCDKDKFYFDAEYESYVYLDDYLFYFPKIDDYLAPSSDYLRLGLISNGYLENNGLFIKKVSLGGSEVGAGEVKPINAYKSSHTGHHMIIKVAFGEGLGAAEVQLRNEYSGYYAAAYQPVYSFIDATKEKEFNEEIITSLYPGIEAENIVVENKGIDKLMREPFSISCNFSAPNMIEKAGQKVLFKVGELIGPQAELYQESARVYKIENEYNRSYQRDIEVAIPEGYVCKNPEVLNIAAEPFNKRKNEAFFVSSYKLEGNVIKITINEEYNQISLPKEDYEDFRKVVNAAADFNKLVLVFEKKG